jgi:hypothetical protein
VRFRAPSINLYHWKNPGKLFSGSLLLLISVMKPSHSTFGLNPRIIFGIKRHFSASGLDQLPSLQFNVFSISGKKLLFVDA